MPYAKDARLVSAVLQRLVRIRKMNTPCEPQQPQQHVKQSGRQPLAKQRLVRNDNLRVQPYFTFRP